MAPIMLRDTKTHSNNVLPIAQYSYWILARCLIQVNTNAKILFVRFRLHIPKKISQQEEEIYQTHAYLNVLDNFAALRQSFPSYDYLCNGQSIPQPTCQFWLDWRIVCEQSSNYHEKASHPESDVCELLGVENCGELYLASMSKG